MNFNFKNEETPLHIASFIKNEKCFDILIKNGASVDEKNIVRFYFSSF